jgi:hypothetical protein
MATAEWKQINRRRKKFFNRHTRLMKKRYIQMVEPLVQEIIENLDQAEQTIETLDTSILEEGFMQIYADVGLDFIKRAINKFKAAAGPDDMKEEATILDSLWIEQMLSYARNEAGTFIVSIKETSLVEVRRVLDKILSEASLEGMGIIALDPNSPSITKKIARAFASEWGNRAEWMARRIAQTETIRASNHATLQGVNSLGVGYVKSWLAGPEAGRWDRQHNMVAAKNQKIPQTSQFNVNGYFADYPGDPRLPAAESINCHCAFTAAPLK